MSWSAPWSRERRLTWVLVVGVVLLAFGAQRTITLGDDAPRQFAAEDGMAISQTVQRVAADVGGEVRAMHVVRSTREEANRVLFFDDPDGPDEEVYVVEATGSFGQSDASGLDDPARRLLIVISAGDPTRSLETSVGDSGPGVAALGEPEALGSRE